MPKLLLCICKTLSLAANNVKEEGGREGERGWGEEGKKGKKKKQGRKKGRKEGSRSEGLSHSKAGETGFKSKALCSLVSICKRELETVVQGESNFDPADNLNPSPQWKERNDSRESWPLPSTGVPDGWGYFS